MVNRQWNYRCLRAIITFLGAGLTIESQSSLAQIVPDTTLGNDNSIVTPNTNVKGSPASLIEGGADRGANLFHSFSEFNIGNLERVYFANPTGIERIFSRVTGNNISNIDGVLGVLGNADLFFLNPNGIIFGQNASLDVNGSFIGSTANSLVFGDEFPFSASNPTDVPPLLTVNILPGLQYGNNPGAITNFSVANNRIGLQVPTGETLALVGGNIDLNGGVISAFGGRVELGSVGENSLVTIDAADNGYTFNYNDVAQFQNITLNSALVDVSGDGGGDLQLQGKDISLSEFSQIYSNTLGLESGGFLNIKAAQSITLSDSIIFAEVNQDASGNGGVISIDTEQLKLIDGSQISVSTYSSGNSGELRINVDELELSGTSPDGQFRSELLANVYVDSNGNGGNLIINSDLLTLANGAQISANTFGQGNTGDIKVKATEIEVSGTSEDGSVSSGIFSQVNDPLATGNAGNLIIKTETLKVEQGGQIAVSSFGEGNAGDLKLIATTVEFIGASQDSRIPSGLFAASAAMGSGGTVVIETKTLKLDRGAQITVGTFGDGNAGTFILNASDIQIIGTSENSSFSSGFYSGSLGKGNGGDLIIETKTLKLERGGQISVGTFGDGNAGDLTLKASKIDIKGNGNLLTGIFSESVGTGEAGELIITTDALKITEGGLISLSTFGDEGQAGDLTLNATQVELIGTDKDDFPSEIVSNSIGRGNGGKLTITTEQLSILDGARISASSQDTGLAGDVEINADSLNLDNSTISTETDAGDGGEIILQINDLLLLRNNSLISTTAGRMEAGGDGGDITINSDVIAAIPKENSDIIANAFDGKGGNINITTQGIFGLEFRPEQTPFSDITASSEFGLDGEVSINTPEVEPQQGLVNLPNTFATPPLDTSCQATNSANSSSFVNLGRGGLPKNPREIRSNQEIWDDLRSPVLESSSNSDLQPRSTKYNPIVEAQSWIFGDKGQIILVADVKEQNNLENYEPQKNTNSCSESKFIKDSQINQ